MSVGSKNAKRAILFALLACVAACALTEPAVAQSSADSLRSFMAQRLWRWRAPNPNHTGQVPSSPIPHPPPDLDSFRATPAPFFPTPIELFPPSNAVPSPYGVSLSGVSCPRVGECVAVGQYTDTTGSSQPMILTQTKGSWGQGIEASLPANAATAPGGQLAYLFGVYCTSVGNCVAAGGYTDAAGNGQPLIVTETGGVWARGLRADAARQRRNRCRDPVRIPQHGDLRPRGELHNHRRLQHNQRVSPLWRACLQPNQWRLGPRRADHVACERDNRHVRSDQSGRRLEHDGRVELLQRRLLRRGRPVHRREFQQPADDCHRDQRGVVSGDRA